MDSAGPCTPRPGFSALSKDADAFCRDRCLELGAQCHRSFPSARRAVPRAYQLSGEILIVSACRRITAWRKLCVADFGAVVSWDAKPSQSLVSSRNPRHGSTLDVGWNRSFDLTLQRSELAPDAEGCRRLVTSGGGVSLPSVAANGGRRPVTSRWTCYLWRLDLLLSRGDRNRRWKKASGPSWE